MTEYERVSEKYKPKYSLQTTDNRADVRKFSFKVTFNFFFFRLSFCLLFQITQRYSG